MRKRSRPIPPNVLANAKLRRTYAEEPAPTKLVLVASTAKGNLHVKGASGLVYDLSKPYLFVDEGDLQGLGDVVDAKIVRGDTSTHQRPDSVPDIGEVERPKRRSRRSSKGTGSTGDDTSDHKEARRVPARDNE